MSCPDVQPIAFPDTPPPHDPEAEQDVVGCLLLRPNLLEEVQKILTADDFWTTRARLVLLAVGTAVANVPDFPDFKAVLRELKDRDLLQTIDDEKYLQACVDRIADATNVPAYCRTVKSFSNRRKVWNLASRAYYAAASGDDYEGTLQELTEVMVDVQSNRAIDNGPVMVCMADVKSRPISWLWPGRVPLGRLTLLVGRPGEGKSFLTTDMASRVTTGSPWPDGGQCPEGSVIFITAEDDPGDTIRPRLDAHGADASRVHLLSAVRKRRVHGKPNQVIFSLADLPALETALASVPDCKLIVIDPIGSFLGGRVDAHRDNEVRAVLGPVAQLAEKSRVAVLFVAHRRKGAGEFADDTALGSRAFTGIARATWHLSRDREDGGRRLLLPGKNNLAPEGTGLAFSIHGDPAALHWESEPIEMTADEAMALDVKREKPGPKATELERACEWLKQALAEGHRASNALLQESKVENITKRTLDRAREKLNIRAFRPHNPGPWYWELTRPGQIGDAHDTPKAEQLGDVATCENLTMRPTESDHTKAECQVSIVANDDARELITAAMF